MEDLLLLGEPNPVRYNCSKRSDDEWFEAGLKRPYMATYLLASGFLFWFLYAIALLSMIRTSLLRKHSCYIIMFTMGLVDLGSLCVSSFASSFLLYKGAVFCNYPYLNWISGSIGLGLWSASCFFCVILASNRFAELADWKTVSRYFQGKNAVLLCFVPILYALPFTFFTPPPLFHSPQVAWFIDPYNESGLTYYNWPHTINNFVVAIVAVAAYSAICWQATKKSAFSKRAQSKVQRQLFVQAFILCTSHVLASFGYLFMNFIPNFPTTLVVVGHIAWQWSHGSPGLVYIIMNQTIQRYALRILTCGIVQRTGVDSSSVLRRFTRSQHAANSLNQQQNQSIHDQSISNDCSQKVLLDERNYLR